MDDAHILTIPIGAGHAKQRGHLAAILNAQQRVELWARRRRWFARLVVAVSVPMAILLYAGHDPRDGAVRAILWLWLGAMILTGCCAEAAARADDRLSRLLTS
jgi:hypothetical protein